MHTNSHRSPDPRTTRPLQSRQWRTTPDRQVRGGPSTSPRRAPLHAKADLVRRSGHTRDSARRTAPSAPVLGLREGLGHARSGPGEGLGDHARSRPRERPGRTKVRSGDGSARARVLTPRRDYPHPGACVREDLPRAKPGPRRPRLGPDLCEVTKRLFGKCPVRAIPASAPACVAAGVRPPRGDRASRKRRGHARSSPCGTWFTREVRQRGSTARIHRARIRRGGLGRAGGGQSAGESGSLLKFVTIPPFVTPAREDEGL